MKSEMVKINGDVYQKVDDLISALNYAESIHPEFPTDIIHALAILSEEAGEAVRAANRVVYEGANRNELQEELLQVGAMAVRCLMLLDYVPENKDM